MSNTLFKNAIDHKFQDTPPIWFMRQAGRYHSHYKKLKEKYSFEELCKIPELASEVACGPVKEFDFDLHSFLFWHLYNFYNANTKVLSYFTFLVSLNLFR